MGHFLILMGMLPRKGKLLKIVVGWFRLKNLLQLQDCGKMCLLCMINQKNNGVA
eukprot:gnl/Chilomastix_caulleri/8509.p1 GENE.gnl/Chilomastix_caulleri/8509~~gnl/Chilomastix_caulleri/8509.p1  ORF type:complete len:54 (+),score=8.37 gnl/Chilomastix_caulleri/8509:127-288(+)